MTEHRDDVGSITKLRKPDVVVLEACATCRDLERAADADRLCRERVEADLKLLNHARVTICGPSPGMTRETIHALADVVRLLHARTALPPLPPSTMVYR